MVGNTSRFVVRKPQPEDAPHIQLLDLHVANFSIMSKVQVYKPEFSQLIAETNVEQYPFCIAMLSSETREQQKLINVEDGSIDETSEKRNDPHSLYAGQALGYIGMGPYKRLLQSCSHTCSILWQIASLSSIGTATYSAVMDELIGKCLTTVLAQSSCTHLLAEFPYSSDNPEHVTWRELFQKHGFVDVGRAKGIYYWDGLYYDRLSLQLILPKHRT